MTSEISKKEFLKRYLGNEEESSRKRKKKTKLAKPKANVPCLKIVNEDIDLKYMNFGEKADDDEDDEAPVIAEVIDERPVEVKLKELYDSTRWKKINNCESSQSDIHDAQNGLSFDRNIKNRRHDSDGDSTPSRKQRRTAYSSVSSPQSHKQNRNRHDSDSDASLPRNPKQNSPPQSQKKIRSKHNSDSDLSPPRRQKQNRSKRNSDSDLSPPRSPKKTKNKHNSGNNFSSQQNQKQNRSRHDSDSDLSPPRSHKISSKDLPNIQKTSSCDRNFKNKRYDSDDDLSPLREQNKHSNASLQKRRQSNNRYNSDSDLSPPRSKEVSSVENGRSKMDKTLSGLKAGLQNSKSLQEEVQELKKREKSQLNMLEDEISGKNADTIIRDRKTGKKRDFNKEHEIKNEKEKKNKEYLQKYEKWGKGTETRNEQLDKLKDEVHEMSKPLARYEDDADLDERLRSIIHDDDPMSAYMKKKKQKETGVSDFPLYTGPPAPPNRFGINPGYRWDGVDRSNGFEAKYFEKINHSKAVKDEAYLWSVQDM